MPVDSCTGSDEGDLRTGCRKFLLHTDPIIPDATRIRLRGYNTNEDDLSRLNVSLARNGGAHIDKAHWA